jgi:hypothetical protein
LQTEYTRIYVFTYMSDVCVYVYNNIYYSTTSAAGWAHFVLGH